MFQMMEPSSSSDEDDACEQDYCDTVDENEYFSTLFERYGSPASFLKRDGHDVVYARSVTIDAAAASVWLKFETDIDGCVVELKDLSGVRMPVRHLTFLPREVGSVCEVKNMLKKHVNLTEYSQDELRSFNQSLGFQLFYENGWECWIALIASPQHEKRVTAQLPKNLIKRRSYLVFMALRDAFKKQLVTYALSGTASRTLMKNDLNDLRKVYVLPDDRPALLSAVQRALESLEVPSTLRPIVFCFRFGEKMTGGLSLTEFDREAIERVTVHAAVDISDSSNTGIDLCWSMSGLQDVVGKRGTLCTCLSFTDCGNFQSNLDGKLADIEPELRRICHCPDKLRFVQLYADIPHLKPKTRFHPISGYVVGGLCFSNPVACAFERDSERYLSTLESNWTLVRKSSCRMEFVIELETIPDVVHATDCIDTSRVSALLSERPMLVPFPARTLECVRELGLWITKELRETLRKFHKTGNVSATWYALQLELASEKLLWGRPLCARSFRYSVNLGPGILCASRSLTDHLGFLALDASSSCMYLDDSIPPCSLWTMSESVGKSITRAAGLHDHLDGSYGVIGRRLLYAVLCDLYEVGKAGAFILFENFLTEMLARKTRFQTVGAITETSLVQLLTQKRRTAVHMVYGVLCGLVEKSGVPLREVLEAGLNEMKLTHFPAVKTYDQHGNAVLTWDLKNNFWTITRAGEVSDAASTCNETYSVLVIGELERRGLIFPSKLKKLPNVLPWIETCIRKLTRENLSQDSTVTTLTFISCIAFMMQGWFIEFDRLAELLSVVKVNQPKLKALEIQSKLELANSFRFKQLRLYRLHHSIPHQLRMIEAEASRLSSLETTVTTEPPDPVEKIIVDTNDTNKITDDDDHVVGAKAGAIERRLPTCQPLVRVTQKAWSREEVEILDELKNSATVKTVRALYEIYKEKCLKQHIPFRTFRALKSKLERLRD